MLLLDTGRKRKLLKVAVDAEEERQNGTYFPSSFESLELEVLGLL